MGHASSYSPRGGVEYVDGGKAILNGVGGLQVMRVSRMVVNHLDGSTFPPRMEVALHYCSYTSIFAITVMLHRLPYVSITHSNFILFIYFIIGFLNIWSCYNGSKDACSCSLATGKQTCACLKYFES